MEAMTVIRHARAAGLILEPAAEGLRVAPRDRLTPELRELLRQHKPDVLAVLTAANDLTTATIDVLLAIHGDGSSGGVDWSAWALTNAATSDSWLVLTAAGLTLLRTAGPVSSPRSYSRAWPLERIAPWPDDGDDLDEAFAERAAILQFDAGLARAEAEARAAELIQRARSCWSCRNLRTTASAADRLPRCDREHRLVWRTTATRTWPGRLDARGCGDRQSGDA